MYTYLRALVVLVAHAPYAVLRVVAARQLRLPPERGAQLLRAAAPHDHAHHLVLDIGPQNDNVTGGVFVCLLVGVVAELGQSAPVQCMLLAKIFTTLLESSTTIMPVPLSTKRDVALKKRAIHTSSTCLKNTSQFAGSRQNAAALYAALSTPLWIAHAPGGPAPAVLLAGENDLMGWMSAALSRCPSLLVSVSLATLAVFRNGSHT